MNAYKVKNQTQNVLKFSDQKSDLFWKSQKYMYITIIIKHLVLWNRLASQSQISCGASLVVWIKKFI